jgi:hypothetical protein
LISGHEPEGRSVDHRLLAQFSTFRSRSRTSPMGTLPFSCPLGARGVYRVNAVLLRPRAQPAREWSHPVRGRHQSLAMTYFAFDVLGDVWRP